MAGQAGLLNDDWRLHKLCQEGVLSSVVEYVKGLDKGDLEKKLARHKGVFGYTPLHEATVNAHAPILDYLLNKGGDVNCRAYSGYTPLHLTASSGHLECVKVLLQHSADISITDEFGKTPIQTAELSLKNDIVRLLKSEEVIKEVEKDGPGLNDLLRGNPDLEADCLPRALIAAVMKGSHLNIGKLVIKGARNIDEALELAKQMKQHAARAMLLLVKAAMTDDHNLVLKLFGEVGGAPPGVDCSDEEFADVQKMVTSAKVSTVVPIEIANRYNHPSMRAELLLRTDVNQKEGTVYWHGLRLISLDLDWLRKIQWVKRLRLARNGFRSLPDEMGLYLRQVVKLDLQYNELTTIPHNILELPSLTELSLSSNKLKELPEIPKWTSTLTVLDLSHNKLTEIPGNPVAPCIRTLNLADNEFHTVPQCVCSFVTLQSLDLSDNKVILSLPAQMGSLRELTNLNLNGLKDLNYPPKNVQKSARDCINYLKTTLVPSSVTANNITSTSMTISWQPPHDPNGVIRSCLVSYTPQGGNEHLHAVFGGTTSTELASLQSHTEYTIHVGARTVDFVHYSTPIIVSTLEYMESDCNQMDN